MYGHSHYKYCFKCGGPLENRYVSEEECERLVCTECGTITYLNPKVVAGAIPEYNGKIFLLRRAIGPRVGTWTFPGGFVDLWESVEDAAIRETREEINIAVEIKSLIGVYSGADNPAVLVVYRVEACSGNPTPGPEALEVKAFAPNEIPWDDLAFWTTKAALEDWLKIIARGR